MGALRVALPVLIRREVFQKLGDRRAYREGVCERVAMHTVVKPAGAASAWSGVEQQIEAVWGAVLSSRPSTLSAVGQSPLAFVLTRVLFNARVGLLAARLIAVSIWDVEFSRYARFYTP